jgi:hypothetical protein
MFPSGRPGRQARISMGLNGYKRRRPPLGQGDIGHDLAAPSRAAAHKAAVAWSVSLQSAIMPAWQRWAQMAAVSRPKSFNGKRMSHGRRAVTKSASTGMHIAARHGQLGMQRQ